MHWLSENFSIAINSVPSLFLDPEDPRFGLVRAMWGLLIIVLLFMLVPVIQLWFSRLAKKRRR